MRSSIFSVRIQLLAAIGAACVMRLNSVGVVDAISAEEAGKFPDQNVADALQPSKSTRHRCTQNAKVDHAANVGAC